MKNFNGFLSFCGGTKGINAWESVEHWDVWYYNVLLPKGIKFKLIKTPIQYTNCIGVFIELWKLSAEPEVGKNL